VACNFGDFSDVRLTGKISRVGILKYTPSGIPLVELTIAVPQTYLEKKTMGYFSLLCEGEVAESVSGKLKVGQKISVQGSLWTRQYKNRQDMRVTEFHIVAKEVGMEKRGEKNEKI
jgi:single-stranded DNA-binding protein